MSSEESERCYDLEHVKVRVLSNMIENSVFPPRKPLDEEAGQNAIVALENFLHEVYCCLRDEVFLKHVRPTNIEPEMHLLLNHLLQTRNASGIDGEKSKLSQPGPSKIDVVTVGSMKNNSNSSRAQGVPVPSLKLCGTYLDDNGFGIGERIGVFLGENELILRPFSGSVDDVDQSAGGVENG